MYKHVKYLFIYHNLNFNVTFLKPFYTLSVKNNFDQDPLYGVFYDRKGASLFLNF